jgi:NADH-quinone oxidoreductase subunit D
MAELRTETMTVNMGPQHPSTHGVLRLVMELDGEVVQSAMPTIGYLHTGIEKTAEQKKWQQVIPLVERMDYLGAQSNSLSYALAVEKLLGLEMPQRVKDIRILLAELQRIASHLIWIGTHGLEIGAVSMLFYAVASASSCSTSTSSSPASVSSPATSASAGCARTCRAASTMP